jgi:hypothetical protein
MKTHGWVLAVNLFMCGVCAPALVAGDKEKQDETPVVDVRGTIKKVDTKPAKVPANVFAVLTIEGPADKGAFYPKASVKVTKASKIFVSDGKNREPAAFKDLKEGQRVEVLFKGLVINDTDPPEGTAGEIIILPAEASPSP